MPDAETTGRDACGVFGVYAPGQPVAHLTYLGLYALQHRGQESAGIAVSDGETITVVKDMGLVTQVFDERSLAPLDGHLAIGHVRYSTTGSSTWRNAQPVYRVGRRRRLRARAQRQPHQHRGARRRARHAARACSPSDSELDRRRLARRRAIARDDGRAPTAATSSTRSARAAAARRCVLVRDDGRSAPHRRARPARLLAARARPDRGRLGARERDRRARHRRRALRARGRARRDGRDRRDRACARSASPRPNPSSASSSSSTSRVPTRSSTAKSVHAARQRMGEELARQAPVDADMVMPVPESGIPAAQGYARESGIPYGDGLVKNRYVGRTFIQPSQKPTRQRRARQAQPAAREHPGQARSWSSTTRSCAAPPRARSSACSARPARPRSTSACRRRRTGGRASTGWTPASAPSCSRPTCRSARSATTSASTRSRTSISTGSIAATGIAVRLVLHRVPSAATTRFRCPDHDTKLAARGRRVDSPTSATCPEPRVERPGASTRG